MYQESYDIFVLFIDVPRVTVAQDSYAVTTGTTVTLQCSVFAIPQATSIIWDRVVNGVRDSMDTTSNRYSGATVNNPSLTIHNTEGDDSGIYRCYAKNAVGTTSSPGVILTVAGSEY